MFGMGGCCSEMNKILDEIKAIYNIKDGESLKVDITGDEYIDIEFDEEDICKILRENERKYVLDQDVERMSEKGVDVDDF